MLLYRNLPGKSCVVREICEIDGLAGTRGNQYFASVPKRQKLDAANHCKKPETAAKTRNNCKKPETAAKARNHRKTQKLPQKPEPEEKNQNPPQTHTPQEIIH